MAALFKLVKSGIIRKNEKVVVISTANGLKFPEFKTLYHENRLSGVTPAHANLPVVLPPDYETVRKAIFDALDRRLGSAS